MALTATEDPLTTQKLTALRIVGNAVADFVDKLEDLKDYSLQSVVEQEADLSEDNIDKSQELIKLCDNFWLALDQHLQLPTFLVRNSIDIFIRKRFIMYIVLFVFLERV